MSIHWFNNLPHYTQRIALKRADVICYMFAAQDKSLTVLQFDYNVVLKACERKWWIEISAKAHMLTVSLCKFALYTVFAHIFLIPFSLCTFSLSSLKFSVASAHLIKLSQFFSPCSILVFVFHSSLSLQGLK